MSTKKKSKNSFKSRLGRTINLSSRKGKFIAFILAFAITGGGYMVYSTYASTNLTWAAENMRAGCWECSGPKAYTTTEYSTSKKGTTVWVAPLKANAQIYAISPPSVPKSNSYIRVCAYIRVVMAATIELQPFASPYNAPSTANTKLSLSSTNNEYIKYCGSYFPASSGNSNPWLIQRSGSIRVASLSVEYR